ncbi:metallophosphoesterase family protein [Devosia sediminis]|uniref:Metallophosphoesterase family protein n=1 Tax=Devosia sediminis TaxID=2798801 RepID=A0A934IUY8_9HYPH|nr:metallophosphoesterase family protein [Devosia sediminis]MBJ3783445.1 metallophosphoesterase family protein [Devosia sediminis]
MRIAVISDVHGNVPALDAVLADMARQQFDAVLCLGDHVSGPMDPAGAAERIMASGAVSIRGNHDRWVVDTSLRGAGAVDRLARETLNEAQLAWLSGLLPTTTLGDELFACHGTPTDDETPWLDNFYNGRSSVLPGEAEVAIHAAGIGAEVILCGHTHIARTLRLSDGRLLVNPGSVGMQLVRGTPDAHYAVIEKRQAGWQTALIGVPYDTEAAARMAEANGFPGWGEAIRYGWAGPDALG